MSLAVALNGTCAFATLYQNLLLTAYVPNDSPAKKSENVQAKIDRGLPRESC